MFLLSGTPVWSPIDCTSNSTHQTRTSRRYLKYSDHNKQISKKIYVQNDEEDTEKVEDSMRSSLTNNPRIKNRQLQQQILSNTLITQKIKQSAEGLAMLDSMTFLKVPLSGSVSRAVAPGAVNGTSISLKDVYSSLAIMGQVLLVLLTHCTRML